MADYYTTGQITLTNGSASIVGVGTAWQIANIAGGTIFAEAAGNPLPLETIADDSHATAAIKWTGPTGTYDYALLRATAFSEQLEANSNIMSRLLVGMEAGTIYRYDVAGDLADRATYDERPEDFGFLAIDVNPAQLFIKASATSGDWAGPFSYGTGPQGDQGPIGPAAVLNWRGAYSGATTYAKNDGVRGSGRSFISLQDANTGHALPVFPATTNAWWDLTAEKGTDGTGTGDVVGPDGTTDDTPAFFDTATGKLLKSKTKAQFKTWLAATALDVSFDNSVANLAGAPATVQAAINALVFRPHRGYLYGLSVANNAVDITNDLDIAAGECASDDTSPTLLKLSAAMTKRLDAVWAAGNNQGGRDPAIASLADGTFYVFIIGNSSTGARDVFITQTLGPTLPSGYDSKRLLLPIVRVGGAIKPFIQDGDQVTWVTRVQDLNALANPGTTAVLRPLTVPVGLRLIAIIDASINTTAQGTAGLVTDPATTDSAPSSTNNNFFVANVGSGIANLATGELQIMTNMSAQVRTRLSASSATTFLSIVTVGFIWSRNGG